MYFIDVNRDLELRYVMDNECHCCIRMDGYCYDLSLILRLKRKLLCNI